MDPLFEVRFRLGSQNNDKFAERLRALAASGRLPAELDVQVRQPKPAVGGFSMTVPPEVFTAVLTAIATTTATELVKAFWAELVGFLKSRDASPPPGPVVVILNGKEFTYDPQALPAEAPKLET